MSDRKYRHRGYMDNDRQDREPRRPASERGPRPPSRLDGAPRGRGVGMPKDAVFKCNACGETLQSLETIDRLTPCPSCGKPLHTCTNCTFFNTGSRFECRKPIEARIESKTAGNDCAFYQPKTVRHLSARSPAAPNDARAAFDALFKK